jgi:hypothetical protein
MFIFSTGPIQANNLPITYQIVNYPTYQDGYTITGTITTDGDLGVISVSDILSWQWTVSSVHASSTDESGLNDTYGGIVSPPTFTASETDLTLISGIFDMYDASDFQIVNSNPSYASVNLEWAYVPSSIENFLTSGYYTSGGVEGTIYWRYGPTGGTQIGGGLIADDGVAVPEPNTLTLLVSALLGLAGVVYLRRRGAKA